MAKKNGVRGFEMALFWVIKSRRFRGIIEMHNIYPLARLKILIQEFFYHVRGVSYVINEICFPLALQTRGRREYRYLEW